MYAREWKMVVPIAFQGILRDVENKMSKHFDGTTVFTNVRGYWIDPKTKRLEEDEAIMISSTRDCQHPVLQHRKDDEFMNELAQKVGQETKQKYMFLQEDPVVKCSIIPIQKLKEVGI
jgi:hypothetical protein